MKKIQHFIITLTLLLLTSCTQDTAPSHRDDQLLIYTSIYPVQYATEQIVGDLAHVKSIYPSGVDPHTYEPTSREITNIAQGDMFIYFGGAMEGFARAIQAALAKQAIHLTELGEYEHLFSGQADGEHENHHDHDPHIWLDPLKMIEIGEIILVDLSKHFPAYKKVFEENFAEFTDDMLELDAQFLKYFNAETENYIIVSHGAYEYWENRYKIIQIPIRGLSSSDEPSQKDLVDIARIAAKQNIHHVLFKQNNEDYVSTIMLEHLNGKKLYIHDLEVLTEDDLKNKEDYLSLMYENLNVLIEATNQGGN